MSLPSSMMSKEGFVWVADVETGPMKTHAAPGVIVRNPTPEPPWIVVDHSIQAVIASRWPGRLWRAEVVEPAAEQLNPGARGTRAVAVRVLHEEPVAHLFGPYGDVVYGIIHKAGVLEVHEVRALADALHPEGSAAYTRAWDTWMASADLRETGSPIGVGFSVLSSVFDASARALAGDAAFLVDEEGDRYLVPPWQEASSALLHAAMAYGAPHLLSASDADILKSAWVSVFSVSD